MNVWLIARDPAVREPIGKLLGGSLGMMFDRVEDVPLGVSPDVIVASQEAIAEVHRRAAFSTTWVVALTPPGMEAASFLAQGANDVLELPATQSSVSTRIAVAERSRSAAMTRDDIRAALSWLGEREREQASLSHGDDLEQEAQATQQLVNNVLGLVCATFGVEGARLLELRRGAFHLASVTHGQVGETEPIDASVASGFALLQSEPVRVNDYLLETRFRLPPALQAVHARSGLHLPVRGQDRRWGVLEVYTASQRDFTEDEVQFAVGAAYRLASALDRRRLGDALQRSESNFRTLIEESPDATAVVRDGLLVLANAAFAALTGRHREDLLGTDPSLLVVAEEQSHAREHLQRSLDTPQASPPETFRFQHPQGPLFVETISRQVVFDDAPSVMLVARDLTERRRLQDNLAAVDRLASVGTLAAGVTHEINNPLAYVSANLAFLGDELTLVSPQLPSSITPRVSGMQSAVADAREGTERIRRIVLDLKRFSRIDLDRIGPIDVRATVETAISLALSALGQQATVERQLSPVPSVQANGGRLAQVFVNLLVNAVQSLPAEGVRQLKVVTRTDERGRAVVEVHDTGVGIPDDIRSRIFEPFFTTKPVGVGTGLGLSVCHGIVTAVGGEIQVESQLGRGSVFRVLLPPTSRPPTPMGLRPIGIGGAAGRGRILVVDDEPLVASSIRRALRQHYEVEIIEGGRAAIDRLLAGARFDLILCDLIMPGLTGMEVYREVQSIDAAQATRMVFMTGGAFTEQARTFLANEPVEVLEKPFDLDQLLRLARARLGSALPVTH